MISIYTVPPSLYCAKLRIVLRHKVLQWDELPPPGGYGSDEYKQIVPSGNLPALVDDDLVVGDSEAIAEYLNEKYPTPAMLPDDVGRRALCRERSRFHDTRLEPEVRALFSHMRPEKRDAVFVATQAEKLNLRLAQLQVLLERNQPSRDNMLTLADCGLPVTCCWIDTLANLFELDINMPDLVRQERERLLVFDAVADEISHYRPKLQAYVAQSTQ